MPNLKPESSLRRISPRVKLAVALLLVIGTALLPRRVSEIYYVPAGLAFLFWVLSRMPVRDALRRLLVVEFFMLGIGILWLLNPAAAPVFLSALAKSNLCVLFMLILTWTTPSHQLLAELRRLRLPSVMLTTLALMSRYLPVLAEESRRMQRARASRTFSRRRWFAWHNLTTIIGQLFIRSADRAGRIYLAMSARGWK